MTAADLPAVLRAEAMLHATPWTPGQFKESLDNPRHHAWLAKRGDDLVGYGVVMRGVDDAELLNLSVIPAFQRQGFGRAMFTKLCDEMRAKGLQRMLLEVRASNAAALALYRQAGCVELRRRRAYYARPVEDAIEMECAL